MKNLQHNIVRFIYTRKVNILGWPGSRRRGVWWLYELRVNERWREVADRTKATCDAVRAWLIALDAQPSLIGFKSKV